MIPITLFVPVILLLLIVVYQVQYRKRNNLLAKIPSSRKKFLIHNTLELFGLTTDQLLVKFSDWHQELGDIFQFTLHPFDDGAIIVTDTKIAETLSWHQPDRTNSMLYKSLARWIGKNGLVLTSGKVQKNWMKIASTALHPSLFKKVSR